MKNRILAILILIGTVAAQTVYGQKEINKTFKGIKTIRMTTASGDCKITKSADASVAITLRHNYDDTTYDPIFEQTGDRLDVKEEFHSRSSNNGNASWSLAVPEGVDIRFRTGSGDIDAAGMKLQLDVTAGSGNATFIKVTGEITVNTGSGDVELDDFNGTIDANIGSGTARVANSKGDLKLNCGSGSIRLADSQAEFRASTGSGSVTGRNLTLAGSSRFNSGSGDTAVGLAGSPKFDISVASGSGNAELNFNGNEIVGEITMTASKTRGSINAPFEFEKVEEMKEWGDQVVVKKSTIKGSSAPRVNVSTGSGAATIRK